MTPADPVAGDGRDGEEPAPRLRFIVSRDDSSCFEYIKRFFAEEPGVEIVYDRRRADRRVAHGTHPEERRSGRDRRQPQLWGDLSTLGWVLVTKPAATTAGGPTPACG